MTDADKPADSRFYGKPLDVKHMIAELQGMMGKGVLEIIPSDIAALITKASHRASNGKAARSGSNGSASQEFLSAENDSLRLLLEQAGIDAKVLLAQAGIDAKEREAADKLQKLILEELRHRIKNTLATVSAISVRRACAPRPASNTVSRRSKAGWSRSAVPMTCCCRRDGPTPAWPTPFAARRSLTTVKAPAGF